MATLTTSNQGSRNRVQFAIPSSFLSEKNLTHSPAVGPHKFIRSASKGENATRRAVVHDKTAQIKDGYSTTQTKRIDLRANKLE